MLLYVATQKQGYLRGRILRFFPKKMQRSTRFPARHWLTEADKKSVNKLRQLLGEMVLDRIASLSLPRSTLDFDGSVQSTKRRAGVTVVGFNKKKKEPGPTIRFSARLLKRGKC
jgi:hypothetical protein